MLEEALKELSNSKNILIATMVQMVADGLIDIQQNLPSRLSQDSVKRLQQKNEDLRERNISQTDHGEQAANQALPTELTIYNIESDALFKRMKEIINHLDDDRTKEMLEKYMLARAKFPGIMR